MKFILAPLLFFSAFASAAATDVAPEAIDFARVVRSPGARSCFDYLEKGSIQLRFTSAKVEKVEQTTTYTIVADMIVQGDIGAGIARLWISESTANPEEGPTTTCKVLSVQE